MDDKTAAFLRELSELSRKYGIAIDGCGCCGSPFLTTDAKVDDPRSGYAAEKSYRGYISIEWIDPSSFKWAARADEIIR